LEEFYEVCKIEELRNYSPKKYIVAELEIVLIRIDEKIYALSNICPHQHASIICDGFLEDDFIVCPSHGWKFKLDTGNQPGGRKGLDAYEVKIVDDKVFVKVTNKHIAW
jgi:nitrite reductase/ring-hydroxylating ferredoxin subunit